MQAVSVNNVSLDEVFINVIVNEFERVLRCRESVPQYKYNLVALSRVWVKR